MTGGWKFRLPQSADAQSAADVVVTALNINSASLPGGHQDRSWSQRIAHVQEDLLKLLDDAKTEAQQRYHLLSRRIVSAAVSPFEAREPLASGTRVQ